MGSTGHSTFATSREGASNETFDIKGAVNYKGKVPTESNLEKVGSNKITLKIASTEPEDVYFQFKLLKNGKMSVIAHDPNVPLNGKAILSVVNPSLDVVINTGNATERRNAERVRQIMNKSAKINESQLQQIANQLSAGKKKES